MVAIPSIPRSISDRLPAGRRRNRSVIWFSLLVVASRYVLNTDFTPPLRPTADPRTGAATGTLTGAMQAPWRAAEPELKVPRASASAQAIVKGATYAFEAISVLAIARSILRSLNLPASIKQEEAKKWDGRRVWTMLNVGNHGIYALLFVIRQLCYTGVGGGDRPFYFESYFLGYLCGPQAFLPRLLGWDNGMYNQPAVLKWMTAVNAGTSSAGGFPNWIQVFIANPTFMYWYQIAEGTFHIMIVLGGLRAFFGKTWPPKKEGDSSQTLFRWGLWLEIIVMDITYVSAYSCLPFLACPGHLGLTTIMMLIHHVNVLPDIMCAWHEWKADRQVAKKSQPALAAA